MKMSKTLASNEVAASKVSDPNSATVVKAKTNWEKPKLEDVSEQVMAQPYIRFT